ncbi:helix-turn-helix transcriptional regulator [Bradyrhizobium sp. NBAIM20]|uniref:helix-turn-helix domain-containing protein n=1 Tax=unclassified Bradyrhizobium TaxID=2631580 RepID=UPI001CD811F3|nr:MULTISPECIES: helix-turn-helix transcriptional regulator [unclassified Bradyrhizobium]MCA1409734.1 helix-turn-helix transcriptional regulator [Bradyrhizobium sp. NBAIM20]MCA1459365.1 helix-turn-helix transcriptional regulator [Bradyrhizobium sp. NBAIM18]
MPSEQLRKPSAALTRILAQNVVRLRRAKGLSQEALADECGLHRTYVGSVERGERNVTLSTLEVFAKALRVSVIDLLTKGTDDSRRSR